MSNINYDSSAWARHVWLTLEKTRRDVMASTARLRRLAEDMREDGGDYSRGPHAPPIDQAITLLEVSTRLVLEQEANWRGYHDARKRMQR